MIEYKIKSRSESPEDTIIEKTGDSVSFSIGQIMANEAELEKLRRQLQAQVDIEAAKMSNIEEHHPFVLTMSEQDMFTAHMYQGAKSIVLVGKDKIKQIEDALKSSAEEREEIKRQIPDLEVKAEVKSEEGVETPVEANQEEVAKDSEKVA